MPPLPTITAEEEGGGEVEILSDGLALSPFIPCATCISAWICSRTRRENALFGTLTRSMEARSCVSAVLIYS